MNLKSREPQQENFWSGFAMGIFGGTICMYLIGTKKGREILQSILKLNEKIENDSLDLSDLLKKVSHTMAEKGQKKEAFTDAVSNIINKSEPAKNHKKGKEIRL